MSVFKKPFEFDSTDQLIGWLEAVQHPLKGYQPYAVESDGFITEEGEVYGTYSFATDADGSKAALFTPAKYQEYGFETVYSEVDVTLQAAGTVLSRSKLI